jgi:SAM-dependent methyltransferase
MTPVLREFSDLVVGFEREPHFVAEARALYPDISFRQVARLDAIPEPDRAFSLILTFTVLQHLVEPVLRSVATEIQRLLKPGGLLVICEETDTSHIAGDATDPNGMCTIGLSVATYEALFPTCALRVTQPRVIEPTYSRVNVGAYMLFERPSAA